MKYYVASGVSTDEAPWVHEERAPNIPSAEINNGVHHIAISDSGDAPGILYISVTGPDRERVMKTWNNTRKVAHEAAQEWWNI